MIAVSGAQAVIRFAQTEDDGDISVGTYLGVHADNSLVIGALCAPKHF